jgi:hypothetical protein
MKPLTKTFILSLLLLSLVSLLAGGCAHEGCTDKSALNFDNEATKDNGSCLYCKTNMQPGDSTQLFLTDTNGRNGFNFYLGDTIVRITINTSYMSYNNSQCGTNSCVVSAKVQNLVNRTIDFSCEFITTSILLDTAYLNFTVPPNGSLTANEIFSKPSSSACALPAIEVIQETNFNYH